MIIAVSFLLLGALLLWLLVGARGPWKLKVVLIVVVPLFMFAVWHALGTYKGWPAEGPVPQRSFIVSEIIIEPDPLTHNPGVIYLWLVPFNYETQILGYKPSQGEPRAYRLPYSRQLHKQLAGVAHRPGLQVLERGHKKKGASGIHDPGAYRAYILPPTLPPKGG